MDELILTTGNASNDDDRQKTVRQAGNTRQKYF